MNYYNLIKIVLVVAFVSTGVVFAQEMAVIKGTVNSDEGKPISGVMIYLDGGKHNFLTEDDGKYHFKVHAGNHKLTLISAEYIDQQKEFSATAGQQIIQNFELKYDPNMILQEVEITGKSIIEQVRDSPFNVVAVDAKAVQNTSMDLAQTLEKTAGLRVRRSGGLGSQTSVMINGFRGSQIKIFMDGMPMENFGSAFQLNNIPVNLADRVEVYKGVVPIELGSDALGGAINIVTKKSNSTYVDASYSYGSFNTHKSNVSVGVTSKKGLQLNVNAFQNYSDNSYKVYTTTLSFDTTYNETGYNVSAKYTDVADWYKRFHDTYHNESVVGRVGLVQQKWADAIMLTATYAQSYKEIQNANLQQIAYGGKLTESKSLIPSFQYYKKDLGLKNLSLRVTANYSRVKQTNVDTLAGQFNWKGEYYKAPNASKGEADYTYSTFRNNTFSSNINLSYSIGKHYFAINNVLTSYVRSTIDEKATETDDASQSYKRKSPKDVLGISYRYSVSDKWTFSVFDKLYLLNVSGPVEIGSNTTTNETFFTIKERSYSTSGYGAVANYQITPDVMLKVSVEKALKLPTATQLFGDQILETGTDSLKPESSKNFNFNVNYSPQFGVNQQHNVMIDAGFVYRDTRDYIRREVEQKYGTASYINHGKVRNVGIDLDLRYFYKRSFAIGSAITYQNITDRERFTESGKLSLNYKDPMKNVPIFYINGDVGYTALDLFGKGNSLTVTYFVNYMQEYYRGWKSVGGDKVIIPEQFSHDARLMLMLKDGRYNFTFEVYNLTNELLYDNFSLQRPGRNMSVTFRFFFATTKRQ